MALDSINPANGRTLKTIPEMSEHDVDAILASVHQAYTSWRTTNLSERAALVEGLAGVLEAQKQELATLITNEMGKPITAAVQEIEKCIWGCRYFAEHGAAFLKDEIIESDGSKSYVHFEPLGIILGVMPWNFPFWQVFRFAVPALMVGNTVVLKHSSNVPQCSLMIEQIFRDAKFPADTFRTLLVGSEHLERVIASPLVAAVTLTGSTQAGKSVAAAAGHAIKKTVLELGGSDPFIVLEDADIEASASTATAARMQNNGQSCIAAKRFIVVAKVYDEFIERFRHHVKRLRLGNPLDAHTTLGPLARGDLRDALHKQVQHTIQSGGRLITGGRPVTGAGFFYEATIIADVKKGMALFDEEVFGPVAAVIKAENEQDAIALANDTIYGLGASIWTKDIEKGQRLARDIQSGGVFINGMVKSDPRLPFGGTKESGYGRELSRHGMLEFVNKKTVWVA